MGDGVNLHVHIDELVLHGFAPGNRARIADALQLELARLFVQGGLPPALAHGGTKDRLNAGTFHAETTARPETTGAHIAQSVYGGLTTWARE